MSKRALFIASFLLLAALIAGTILYPVIYDQRDLARRKNQAKDIYLVCQFYGDDHEGRMPNSFSQLSLWNREKQRAPGVSIVVERELDKFELVNTGLTATSDPSLVLVRERTPDRHGALVICHVDGSSEVIRVPKTP